MRSGWEINDVSRMTDDLVPSEIACFDSSPGRIRRTAVWISREEMVLFLLYDANSTQSTVVSCRHSTTTNHQHVLEASEAIRSKISFTNELRMAIALFEMPVSG